MLLFVAKCLQKSLLIFGEIYLLLAAFARLRSIVSRPYWKKYVVIQDLGAIGNERRSVSNEFVAAG
jgi:hypothetical protein